jgi:hypothetical protein
MEACDYFRAQARGCRELAATLSASAEKEALLMLARHYDREAGRAAPAGEPKLSRPSLRAL